MNRDVLRFSGIRKKLIIYYLIITVLLGVTSIFSYYNAKLVLTRLNSIVGDYAYLNNLNNNVNVLMTEVEKYLTSKSSENLLNYYTAYNSLQEQTFKISREAVYDNDKLMLKDIGNMIDELLRETDSTVRAKRGRISSEYIAHFTRSNQISEYIKFYINNLLNNKLQEGSERYNAITRSMSVISYMNLLIIVLVVIITLVLTIVFTYRLTKPISELSHSAERISRGDFNVELMEIKTNDEINVLSDAFNKMVVSIKSYINELKLQAEFENRLSEQEMQNLRMKSLLKDAELKSLQSQINPHFLFNTLNAASQLSMMEGADKTSEFIQNIAELFRYNLRKLDEPATLADEIKYVKNYMFILKTRFGNRIEFFTDIDESLLEVRIPCTVIQPIVENSYIHGLQNLERNGEIHLNVRRKEEYILIEIIDNGAGIEEKRIDEILNAGSAGEAVKKHVSGIGLSNVVERLLLFYNLSDASQVIDIESGIDKGTKVTLRIPVYSEGGVQIDKAVNS